MRPMNACSDCHADIDLNQLVDITRQWWPDYQHSGPADY